MSPSCQKLFPCLCIIGAIAAAPVSAAGPEPVLMDPPVSAPAVTTDWSGAYGGLSFGAAFGRGAAELDDYFGSVIDNDVDLGLFPQEIDGSQTNAIGGLTVGYNVQRERFLGGVEFDISIMNQDIENEFQRLDDQTFSPAAVWTNTSYRTEIDGLATLRLRGGFARDRDLFYATGGLAAGQVTNGFTLALPGFPFNPDYSATFENEETLYGYIVGAGYERRITDRLSVKGEVMYYDLEDVTIKARDPATFGPQGLDYEFSNDGYLARVGINLSF